MSTNNRESAAQKAQSNMMRLGLVAVAMAGVIAFYVLTGRVDLGEPVELTASVTQPATWTESGPLTLGASCAPGRNLGLGRESRNPPGLEKIHSDRCD